MKAWHWLVEGVVIAVHAEQIAEHGGSDGIRDRGLLSSALDRPRNLAGYGMPTVFDLAAAYAFGIMQNHPFIDGNGRSARLLMNLLLLQSGYPPALIRKEDRSRYINSLEQAQLGGSLTEYYQIIGEAVERSLDIYLEALTPVEQATPSVATNQPVKSLKIGELAKATGTNNATLRFWVQANILPVAGSTAGGYQLFSPEMIARVQLIRKLQQEQRLTIDEISQYLKGNS